MQQQVKDNKTTPIQYMTLTMVIIFYAMEVVFMLIISFSTIS